MNKIATSVIVCAGILLFSVMAAIADDMTLNGKVTIDENELREVIKKVIKENPKLILNTINTYVKDEKQRKREEQLESSFKNPIKDIVATDANPSVGPKEAVITIVEYTDFECPYCSKGAKTVKKVLKKYPEKVRLVFKNNPLDFHKQAIPAARAALAANRQGKFWEYHDLLFKKSSKLSEDQFVKFAKKLKLDMEKFDKDRKSPEIAKQVLSEMAEAKKHGLKGTPTFVVNGIVIRGAQKLDYFSRVIDRLLEEKD